MSDWLVPLVLSASAPSGFPQRVVAQCAGSMMSPDLHVLVVLASVRAVVVPTL